MEIDALKVSSEPTYFFIPLLNQSLNLLQGERVVDRLESSTTPIP